MGFPLAEALSECQRMVRPPGLVNLTPHFSSPSTESPLRAPERYVAIRRSRCEGEARGSLLSLVFLSNGVYRDRGCQSLDGPRLDGCSIMVYL